MDRIPRQTLIAVAAVLVLGLAVALGLAGLLRPGQPMPTATSETAASFPPTAAGHDVLTVPDALDAEAGDDASELAVAGWFQQPFARSCPVPMVIEGCSSFAGWLLAQPESVVHHQGNTMWTSPAIGPSIDVVFDGPDTDWARPLPPEGDAVPTAVVFVGHFHDARAAGCQPMNRAECESEFVVTSVAWVNGVDNL